MRILVTGGAGYIGSVITADLVAHGHDTTVLDNLSTGHADAVAPEATLFVGNILTDATTVIADAGFDAIVHLAGKSLVAQSVTNPHDYWTTNTLGTLTLAQAATQHRIPRFIFSSTAAVYGQPTHNPITEDHPTNPTNPYGASKLAADHILTSYANAHGLAAISLRYFNVAGAVSHLRERHAPETHLIPSVLEAAADPSRHVTIHGRDYPTADGTCIRDYIHVADLSTAHLLALEAAVEGHHQTLNLGSQTGHSVAEVITTAEQVTGRHITIHNGPRRPGDPTTLIASGTSAHRILGWQATRSLEQAIQDAWTARTQGWLPVTP